MVKKAGKHAKQTDEDWADYNGTASSPIVERGKKEKVKKAHKKKDNFRHSFDNTEESDVMQQQATKEEELLQIIGDGGTQVLNDISNKVLENVEDNEKEIPKDLPDEVDWMEAEDESIGGASTEIQQNPKLDGQEEAHGGLSIHKFSSEFIEPEDREDDNISSSTRVCDGEAEIDVLDQFSSGTRICTEEDLRNDQEIRGFSIDGFPVDANKPAELVVNKKELCGIENSLGDCTSAKKMSFDDAVNTSELDVPVGSPDAKVFEEVEHVVQEIPNDLAEEVELKEAGDESIGGASMEIRQRPVVDAQQEARGNSPTSADLNENNCETDSEFIKPVKPEDAIISSNTGVCGEEAEADVIDKFSSGNQILTGKDVRTDQQISGFSTDVLSADAKKPAEFIVEKEKICVEDCTSTKKALYDHTVSSPKSGASIGSPGAKLKRDWHEESLSKLTCVRSALRQRGNIKSLVSKFESLAENPEEVSTTTNVINISPKNMSPFAKVYPGSFTPQKQVRVADEDHSPADRSTVRSTSSKAIDKMFEFVQKAEISTPKSTLADRPRSTPRCPMVSSTSFTASQLADPPCRDLLVEKEELAFREKSKALLKEIEMLKEQITRSAEAITVCQKKHDFNGTLQELSAQRILLVASERRLLLTQKMDKLKEVHTLRHTSASRGWVKMPELDSRETCTIVISSISIRLDRNFYIKTADDDSSFVFVVIAKCEGQLYATQLLDVMDIGTVRASSFQVRESIRFDQLPMEFVISIEVFAIKIGHRLVSHSSTALKIAGRAKAFLVGKSKTSDSDQEVLSTWTSDFFRCGIVHINRESIGKLNFSLLDSQYPLDGTIELRAAYMFGRKKSISSVEHL